MTCFILASLYFYIPEIPWPAIRLGMRIKAVKHSCKDTSKEEEQDDADADNDEVRFGPVGFAGVTAFVECPDE